MRIFISYSRVDRSFVDDLIPLLRRVYGLDMVWFDDEIYGGQKWWNEILAQIANCNIFIYLLSDHSISSAYCQAEYTEAYRLLKPILPVLIRAQTNVPSDLSQTQYVDLTTGLKDVESLSKLFASIRRLLQQPLEPRWLEQTPLPSSSDSETTTTITFPPTPPEKNDKLENEINKNRYIIRERIDLMERQILLWENSIFADEEEFSVGRIDFSSLKRRKDATEKKIEKAKIDIEELRKAL